MGLLVFSDPQKEGGPNWKCTPPSSMNVLGKTCDTAVTSKCTFCVEFLPALWDGEDWAQASPITSLTKLFTSQALRRTGGQADSLLSASAQAPNAGAVPGLAGSSRLGTRAQSHTEPVTYSHSHPS